jgi:Icc-related predicted phosphoesterase
MKVACIADLHENLVEVPPCDLLVIAGDLVNALKTTGTSKEDYLLGPFRAWLETAPAERVVVVAGNHDFVLEQQGFPTSIPASYLEDQATQVAGVHVWGAPWQPWFGGWAFNAPREGGEAFLDQKYSAIPAGTDIIVSHGPPLGHGDRVGDRHVGSSALAAAIDRVQPRLVVCGHIHSAAGCYKRGDTTIVNAAVVGERYEAVRTPVVLDV